MEKSLYRFRVDDETPALYFIDEETPDMYFLRAIECAIVALSKCPAATDRLLNVLCEAYEAVNKHNKD